MSESSSPTGGQSPRDSLGQLRESLSALGNLQQMLASVHAGPKLLAGLLPEVQASAQRMLETQLALLDHVESETEFSHELHQIRAYVRETSAALEATLVEACAGPLQARRRLHLEAALMREVPQVSSLVEHVELLILSVRGVAVGLPLAELLSSRPTHGSSRPLRHLLVGGPAEELIVQVPPRVGLGALSLLSRGGTTNALPALEVRRGLNERVHLRFCTEDDLSVDAPGRLHCHMPIMQHIPPSHLVAQLVLRTFGAEFEDGEPTTFSLPSAPHQD